MKSELTPEQFDRLPKYAQRHISELERRAEVATRTINKTLESQAPTKIWTTELENYEGENKIVRRYFDAESITIEQKGVKLRVSGLWGEDESISLSWGAYGSLTGLGLIAFVPTAHQQAKLINIVYDEHELDRLNAIKEGDKQ